MKKILFALVTLAFFSVKADYLYWMVTSDPGTGENFIGQTVNFNTWTDARLYYNGDSFSDGTLAGTMNRGTADDLNSVGLYAYSDIGEYGSSYTDASTFFIELWSGDSYLGRATGSYGDVVQNIFKPNSMAPLGSAWIPTSYAVPEPTSGLLFLIGGMLLGLKRRRQQV